MNKISNNQVEDYFILNGKKRNQKKVFLTTSCFIAMIHFIKYINILSLIIKIENLYNLDFNSKILFDNFPKLLLFFTLPVSFLYIFICSGLEIWFYVLKKNAYKKWKCQTNKWLSFSDKLKELNMSLINLFLGGILMSLLTIINSYTPLFKIYIDLDDHSISWYWISLILFFIYIDLSAYIIHRMLHIPIIYKTIHKQHHYFISVTPFSALALHPIEYISLVISTLAFLVFIPTHITAVIINLMYVFIFNIINHSGIKNVFKFSLGTNNYVSR